MNRNNIYKGCLESLIIQLIHEDGPLYGYDITQKAKAHTEGALKITEGTLYPLLHKLEDEGILESYIEAVGNRPRKYYKIAASGRGKVKEAQQELRTFIEHLQTFLTPKRPSIYE